MPKLPIEVWEMIASYLGTLESSAMMSVNKRLSSAAVKELYKTPKFHPLSTQKEWRAFIDLIYNKNGMYPYHEYIEMLDDIWLFIGGESLQRKDSLLDDLIDLKIDEDVKGDFPMYSIYHFISYLMKTKLMGLKLHFHSDLIINLPWNESFSYLTSLEIGFRVSDSFFSIFESVCGLKELIFHQAEISDDSINALSLKCRKLVKLEIMVTPISKRSRYQLLMDSSLENLITDASLESLFLNLKDLKYIQIRNLQASTLPFRFLKSRAESLVLTLCKSFRSGSDDFLALLNDFEKLESLEICGSLEKESIFQDSILSEDFILALPNLTPIKSLTLKNVDICRNERNSYQYYGLECCSWELDAFRMKFAGLFPNVALYFGN